MQFEPHIYRNMICRALPALSIHEAHKHGASTTRANVWDNEVKLYVDRWSKAVKDAGIIRHESRPFLLEQLAWCAAAVLYHQYWQEIRNIRPHVCCLNLVVC